MRTRTTGPASSAAPDSAASDSAAPDPAAPGSAAPDSGAPEGPARRAGAALSALVTVKWGDTVVAARHLEGDAEAHVGAAPRTLAPLPRELLGAPSLVVARVRNGAAIARVPRGAVGFRERPRAIPSPVGGPSEITLAVKETVSFSLGEFVITVTAEEASRAPWAGLPFSRGSLAPARYFAAAALAHGLLIGLSAQAAYASNVVEAPPDHRELARYLAAAEDRSRTADEITGALGDGDLGRDVNAHDGNGKDGGGTRAKGPEGSMGSAVSRGRKGRFAIGGRSGREASPPATRDEAMADARSFGLAGVLTSPSMRAPISGLADAAANGPDPFDAKGAMWATSIGETSGAGGLGLTGIGEGGGGDGVGSIGLGTIGTIGHTSGNRGPGTGGGGEGPPGLRLHGVSWGGHWDHGIGIGIGRVGRIGGRPAGPLLALDMKAPERPERVAEEGDARLPPDVIRRIVRQSHGRFRACYQGALLANPALAGGVTTSFLIGADGRVKSAQNAGGSLPDRTVVACVTRAFAGLVFPAPPGGRPVTVTYPLTFSPE